MSQLHEVIAGRKQLQYRTPIVQRGDILGSSQANTEKRALKDAARALAQLWRGLNDPVVERGEGMKGTVIHFAPMTSNTLK